MWDGLLSGDTAKSFIKSYPVRVKIIFYFMENLLQNYLYLFYSYSKNICEL